MVFKTWGGELSTWQAIERPPEPVIRREAKARQHQRGDLIALVEKEVERITLDNGALLYNLADQRVLMPYRKNDRGFDVWVGLPFTKGVTERASGRTQLILGSPAHHIEAMQNQFAGALWTDEEKSYGDTIRWLNVGDLKQGFIGLDYNPDAGDSDGVARNKEDVSFLAKTLLSFGYEQSKRLFLLEPPYIKESAHGRKFRSEGYCTLRDYAR